jgi:mRNA interferase MazF
MAVVISRFDVFLVNLDPTIGSEIKKTRPCLIISPNEMNRNLRTVVVAPMTTRGASYPTRVSCKFRGKQGQIVLDQIRTVDRQRVVRKLGTISEPIQEEVLSVLGEIFAE